MRRNLTIPKAKCSQNYVKQELDENGDPINPNTVKIGQSHVVDESLPVLVFPDPVRMRPGMYIGDVGVRGLHHLLWEIVNNAVDESVAGHATQIDVTLGADYSLSVRDNGRGIPTRIIGNTGKTGVEYVLTDLSWDRVNVHGDDAPLSPKYLRGVGAAVVNALSERLVCETRQGGTVSRIAFERGIVVSPLETTGTCDANDTGTTVTWLADKTIFARALSETGDLAYNPVLIADRLRELSYFVPRCRFTFHDRLHDAPPETFHSSHGVADFVRFLNRDRAKPFPAEPIVVSGTVGNVRVEVALQWANGATGDDQRSYVNTRHTWEGGTPLTGFRHALTRAVNRAQQTRISGKTIRNNLTAIVAVFLPNPMYNSADVARIMNPEAENAVFTVVYRGLQEYLATHSGGALPV